MLYMCDFMKESGPVEVKGVDVSEAEDVSVEWHRYLWVFYPKHRLLPAPVLDWVVHMSKMPSCADEAQ